MAKVALAYADASGATHATPENAALADLTVLLGRIGAESGMTAGFAKTVLDKRAEIEVVFADLDAMRAHQGGPA